MPSGSRGEGQPRVADHRLQVRLAVPDIGEIFRIARGIDHGLVDLEELPGLARLGGAGQRARAEPDHRDAQRRALALADRRDRLPDAAILVIIGDRLGPAGHRRAVVVLEFLRRRGSWCRASARDTGRAASPRSCGRRRSCARFPPGRRRPDRPGSAPAPARRCAKIFQRLAFSPSASSADEHADRADHPDPVVPRASP